MGMSDLITLATISTLVVVAIVIEADFTANSNYTNVVN